MKTIIVLALTLQLSAVAFAQSVSPSAPPAPQILDVRSGEHHLKVFLETCWSRPIPDNLVQSWLWR